MLLTKFVDQIAPLEGAVSNIDAELTTNLKCKICTTAKNICELGAKKMLALKCTNV